MATIISFPSQPVSDQRRLERALERLERSLREQQAAFAQWRRALDDLDQAVGGLEHGLLRYEDELAAAAAGIDAIGETSRHTASLMSAPMFAAKAAAVS